MRLPGSLGIAITLTLIPLAAATAQRPQGPCDIYGAAGTPCVAAHSTTRALSASYTGPLYQVKRRSDGTTLDVGIVSPGGYANAAAQDAFCANALCVINRIYDQSGKGNHLYQAPPGTFKGPEPGGFDTQPIADMARITISGHKAYGVYIIPGMGLRNNNATGIAINDEPEGIYYVVDGKHFDSGCCFDYGNSSTNGRAVGTGTMETTYFGTSTVWGRGNGPGPWIMTDLEAGLFSGYDAKENTADPTIGTWRFVTAVVDGGGGNRWDLRGGDARQGRLTTFYSGVRPGSPDSAAYFPMHKQGGILLGDGGDNGNGSSGTFYEGVMTTGYPTAATTDAVQANIVAAKYDEQRLSLSRLTTFTPGSSQDVTATFTNTTGASVTGVRLSLALPAGWSARPATSTTDHVAPGASVTATFQVTSPAKTGAGFLAGTVEWRSPANRTLSDKATARLRNALPVKINEVRLGTGVNPTNQFIELYNASAAPVDISGWTLTHTPSQWPTIVLATIPSGTRLASHAYYLLGLAACRLAAPAAAGATNVLVRSASGFQAGQKIDIGGESRTITSVGSAAMALTTLFIPVSTGPWLTIPAGSTNLPVTSTAGFEVGQKISIDIGGKYELATVTAVGKAGTQTTLSAPAIAGVASIKVASGVNLAVGDKLTIGTGAHLEHVTVAALGPDAGVLTLTTPLRFDHMLGVDVAGPGTGISFSPATKFPHVSGEAVQALGTGLMLDRPLSKAHPLGEAIVNAAITTTGYQGPPAPQQWFGGTLASAAGSIALLDTNGAVVVDAIVYGSQQSNSSANGTIASPELATLEADQGKGGCIAVVSPASTGANRSLSRYPDGADADHLCTDFVTQTATTLPTGSTSGATNIKVASVAGFAAGQTLAIDPGENLETAVIVSVGTAGAATVSAALEAGTTVIPAAPGAGFTSGQTITIDGDARTETAVIASISGGRGGARITLASPLKSAHAAGASIHGSGITLTAPLARTHGIGSQVSLGLPTPGGPNRKEGNRN